MYRYQKRARLGLVIDDRLLNVKIEKVKQSLRVEFGPDYEKIFPSSKYFQESTKNKLSEYSTLGLFVINIDPHGRSLYEMISPHDRKFIDPTILKYGDLYIPSFYNITRKAIGRQYDLNSDEKIFFKNLVFTLLCFMLKFILNDLENDDDYKHKTFETITLAAAGDDRLINYYKSFGFHLYYIMVLNTQYNSTPMYAKLSDIFKYCDSNPKQYIPTQK